jgi:hypothetical protein
LDDIGDVGACEWSHLCPTLGRMTSAPSPHIEVTPEGQSPAANAEANQFATPFGGSVPTPAKAQVVIPVEKACATAA